MVTAFARIPLSASRHAAPKAHLSRGLLTIKEAGPKPAQVSRNHKAARLLERFLAEAACKKPRGFRPGLQRRLGIIRRVADHYGLRGRQIEFTKRHADKARVGLAVFDIVAARGGSDELRCVQQGEIAFESAALTIRCKRDLPAMFGQRTKQVPRAVERLNAKKVFAFEDRTALLQDFLTLILGCFR